MAFGGPAEVLELIQAERPMLAIDEDEIEVELPQNIDHPWGWEGKIVAVRLASGTHGGFDSVGLFCCQYKVSSSSRWPGSTRRCRCHRRCRPQTGPVDRGRVPRRRRPSPAARCCRRCRYGT